MKKSYSIVCLYLSVLVLLGCKKDEPITPSNSTTTKPTDFGSFVFGSVKDVEGNEYKTVVIGSNTWMAENLRTTKYQDGSAMIQGTTGGWTSITSGAYYTYNSNKADVVQYGRLYNGFAKIDSKKVCPADWHIPSDDEWKNAENALGNVNEVGGKMKEAGTAHWNSPNVGADNSIGFTGLPGGSIYKGNLTDFGNDGYWWSSTTGSFFYLTNSQTNLRTKSTALLSEGLSIRCVKDK